nr:hypothetical protein B0A51_12884 [Rachicladosporium sp. CCFEE 5018]
MSAHPARPAPRPSYMSDDQMASYLKDLRTSKSRPIGSRPAPPSKFGSLRRVETEGGIGAVQSGGDVMATRPTLLPSMSMPVMPSQALAGGTVEGARGSRSPFAGRPVARLQSTLSSSDGVGSGFESPTKGARRSVIGVDGGNISAESQDVGSLRESLGDLDLAEERRIHLSAQDEAARLVWSHQNPGAPMPNLDVGEQARKPHTDMSQSSVASGRPNLDSARTASEPAIIPGHKLSSSLRKGYGDLAAAVKKDIEIARRRTSSGGRRVLSAEKKKYMQPTDKIYEDPQEESTAPRKPFPGPIPDLRPDSAPLLPATMRKNPFARMRMQQDRLERTQSAPVLSPTLSRLDRVEIQRNPPSQSRNADYRKSVSTPPAATSPTHEAVDPSVLTPVLTPTKDGKEIRSDDIRQATSKQRKDRSPNLPQPTVVSEKSNRPIVSFQKDWKPKEVSLDEVKVPNRPTERPQPPTPGALDNVPQFTPPRTVRHTDASSSAAYRVATDQLPIPSICFPDADGPPTIPTINLPDDGESKMPTIVLPEEPNFASSTTANPLPSVSIVDTDTPSINDAGPDFAIRPSPIRASTARPLPTPAPPSQRPLPTPTQHTGYHHAATSPIPKSTPHYTPSLRQSSAVCAACSNPIAGRILSAAGQRFHPACFACDECHTNLELVAFYPEPTPDHPTSSAPRFYCHLDYHELFSPRCKSCKTPIENECIVACGASWHSGHFFCAQCGDPFDATMPFVEKDGGCRKPVVDVVVKALGAEWHGKCFVCVECKGEFEDGRYFLRGESEDPVEKPGNEIQASDTDSKSDDVALESVLSPPLNSEAPAPPPPPPNGGYGWVCTACVLLINAHTWGLNSSYGVFLAHYLAHSTFPGATYLMYAFVGSLSISCAMLVSPLATLTTRTWGTRTTLLIGVALQTASLLGASWAKEVWQLFLSQGVAFGVGMGFLFVGSVGIIPQWFTTRRSLANGVGTCGSGLGGLVYSLAAGRMIETIGLAWTFRVLGLVAAVVNTGCALLIRDRNKAIGSNQGLFDHRLFRRPQYLLLCSYGFFSILGYVVLLFSLANYARTVGLSASQASTISALFNFSQALGRPFIGLYSDSIGRINMAMLATLLSALFTLLFWPFATSYGALLAYVLLSGTVAGTFWCTVAPVAAEVVGVVDVPSALNMLWLVVVVPCTFSEPIALEIVGGTGHYIGAQLFAGFMYLAAALSLLLMRGWKIGEVDVVQRLKAEGREKQEAAGEMQLRIGYGAMIKDCLKVRKV